MHELRDLVDFKENAQKSKRGMDYKFNGEVPMRITLKRDETLEMARGNACEDESFFDFWDRLSNFPRNKTFLRRTVPRDERIGHH